MLNAYHTVDLLISPNYYIITADVKKSKQQEIKELANSIMVLQDLPFVVVDADRLKTFPDITEILRLNTFWAQEKLYMLSQSTNNIKDITKTLKMLGALQTLYN